MSVSQKKNFVKEKAGTSARFFVFFKVHINTINHTVVKPKRIGYDNTISERRDTSLCNAVHDKDLQLKYLKTRLNLFMNVIDSLDPESIEVDDIDRLIKMLDELKLKREQFKKEWDKE